MAKTQTTDSEASGPLSRISLSLDTALVTQLNRLAAEAHYENRSGYVRDMIREKLVQEKWTRDTGRVLATYTLVFDHHQRELCGKLIERQHDAQVHILAATHVHLSHELCAEMIMATGSAGEVKDLYDALKTLRGVLHATLSMSSLGDNLK